MGLWGKSSEGPVPKPPRLDRMMVRQAVAEIQEACGQIVQSFDPDRYPTIADDTMVELSRHKLHEAATNLEDAATMLRRACPEVPL